MIEPRTAITIGTLAFILLALTRWTVQYLVDSGILKYRKK